MQPEVEPLVSSPPPKAGPSSKWTTWIALAISSGACAAINGVFAKLTTTELTSSWAAGLSTAFGLAEPNRFIEILIRAVFFLLNLAFNALMWALFTSALTRASSTTRVAIINTSTNFLVTAFLGLAIFRERLPLLWWLGATGLVAGSVIIGRREEQDKSGGKQGPPQAGESEYRDEQISDGIDLGREDGDGGSREGNEEDARDGQMR